MGAVDFILWGGRGHARVIRDILGASGLNCACIVDNDPSTPAPWSSCNLVVGMGGLRRWLGAIPQELRPRSGVVAIGGARGLQRLQIEEELIEIGFAILDVRDRSAIVAPSAALSSGCQLLAGSIVGSGTRLERSVIVNTGAQVDHDCSVGAGSHIGPGAVLCGQVSVGRGVFVGANATVLPGLTIGDDALIGAGAVVTRDVISGSVVIGSPARQR